MNWLYVLVAFPFVIGFVATSVLDTLHAREDEENDVASKGSRRKASDHHEEAVDTVARKHRGTHPGAARQSAARDDPSEFREPSFLDEAIQGNHAANAFPLDASVTPGTKFDANTSLSNSRNSAPPKAGQRDLEVGDTPDLAIADGFDYAEFSRQSRD